MWDRLGHWLKRASGETAPGTERHLALAVVMAEAARADFERSPVELATIARALTDAFGMAAAEAEALVDEAVRRADSAISMHEFVGTLNRELDADGKARLIGWLWRIANADGRIDAQEEGMIRRMADLLYVPHSVLVQQRLATLD
ncbi:MAG TPA: TerB family tellurite resistance protein [Solimonas sp.]